MGSIKYRKVLIFGQPFNFSSGGGITLSNLFKLWPKENIAVLYAPWGDDDYTTDICGTYYQIGNEEHSWHFPFNLFKSGFPVSGLKSDKEHPSIQDSRPKRNILKQFIAQKFVSPFVEWLGLDHINSEIHISERLKEWLSEYKPDILYLQVSSLEGIRFGCILTDYLKIPSIVHMMDDWPSTISRSGPLKRYWQSKINGELLQLFGKVEVHLSISDAMTEEYKERYKKTFIPFHNPIDTERWLLHSKKDYSIDRSYIKILYSGRIGTGITSSILDVASAIDSVSSDELNIKLHIQTTTHEPEIIRQLVRFKCIVMNPVAEYNRIPEIFSDADILLLANDFAPRAEKFLKLSMPTKASEYMISGVPVLVYAPESVAVSKFFSINNCGHCLNSDLRENIVSAIMYLIDNKDYREFLGRRAVALAIERFDSGNVRISFHSVLLSAGESHKANS
jgi:glycosyltransferase involved in cell wall biosynthesis